MPDTVILEHLHRDGCAGGITIVKEHVVKIRPAFLGARSYQRTTCLPGEARPWRLGGAGAEAWTTSTDWRRSEVASCKSRTGDARVKAARFPRSRRSTTSTLVSAFGERHPDLSLALLDFPREAINVAFLGPPGPARPIRRSPRPLASTIGPKHVGQGPRRQTIV